MRILVVSPHPDDETLGIGGSLLRFRGGGEPAFLAKHYGYVRTVGI